MPSHSQFRQLGDLIQRTAAIVLVLATVAVLLVPEVVRRITGVSATPILSAPDDLPPLDKDDATPFFQSRNQIEVIVPEATTLREFLDRNRLNKPFHRKQIVEQLGSASPDATIEQGSKFTVRLTPVAEDVPGLRPMEGTN